MCWSLTVQDRMQATVYARRIGIWSATVEAGALRAGSTLESLETAKTWCEEQAEQLLDQTANPEQPEIEPVAPEAPPVSEAQPATAQQHDSPTEAEDVAYSVVATMLDMQKTIEAEAARAEKEEWFNGSRAVAAFLRELAGKLKCDELLGHLFDRRVTPIVLSAEEIARIHRSLLMHAAGSRGFAGTSSKLPPDFVPTDALSETIVNHLKEAERADELAQLLTGAAHILLLKVDVEPGQVNGQ